MILYQYFKTCLLGLIRTPSYSLVTILVPSVIFVIVGVTFSDSRLEANFALGSFCVFSSLGVAFFQFGVGIANDRESPWEQYARVLPVHPLSRLFATILASLVFVSVSICILIVVAFLTTDIGMPTNSWFKMLFGVFVGVFPLAAMGLTIGYWCSPKGALPVANLLYIILAFLGGIFFHPSLMPEFMNSISIFTPVRHIVNLTQAGISGEPWTTEPFLILLAYTILFLILAAMGYRRDEAIKYS